MRRRVTLFFALTCRNVSSAAHYTYKTIYRYRTGTGNKLKFNNAHDYSEGEVCLAKKYSKTKKRSIFWHRIVVRPTNVVIVQPKAYQMFYNYIFVEK